MAGDPGTVTDSGLRWGELTALTTRQIDQASLTGVQLVHEGASTISVGGGIIDREARK